MAIDRPREPSANGRGSAAGGRNRGRGFSRSAHQAWQIERQNRKGKQQRDQDSVASALAETRAVMGEDFWPYGFARNRDEIAAMTRYAHEDGLAAREVDSEELFHPSTLGLAAQVAR